MADSDALRLDKWLWHARFFKSRSIAKTACESRRFRVNGTVVEKPSKAITVGDVLTFPYQTGIIVVQVEGLGTRRGPATEAQELYTVIEAPQKPDRQKEPVTAERERGSGRPTKKQRREIDKLMGN